jgi:hypothetical protein
MLPAECSIVQSWGTHKLGRRGRGRIYPPPLTVAALDAYGNVSSGAATSLMGVTGYMLENIGWSGSGGDLWNIRPVVTGPSTTHGTGAWVGYAVIDSMRVGTVVDVQRRRRNKLPENYVSMAITH